MSIESRKIMKPRRIQQSLKRRACATNVRKEKRILCILKTLIPLIGVNLLGLRKAT